METTTTEMVCLGTVKTLNETTAVAYGRRVWDAECIAIQTDHNDGTGYPGFKLFEVRA